MNKCLVLVSLVGVLVLPAQAELSSNAERLRIANDRTLIEASSQRDDSACYQRFFVNNCLDAVRLKRGAELADLRRQEAVLDDQERKAKGAEQLKKTEDKESAEKQQAAADKRADALKSVDDRLVQQQQKNKPQASPVTEKRKRDADTIRLKSVREKKADRAAKPGADAESVRQYNQRLEKAKERQAKLAEEKARQTKPLSDPLPIPK